MQYRHEVKHYINYADMLALKARLDAVAKPDPNAINGEYLISSLYFDNYRDKALTEKLNGKSHREKFRIRYYNNDTSVIRLEKKVKDKDLGYKKQCKITKEEVRKILDGDYSWMLSSGRDLIVDLYISMMNESMRPVTIVAYRRIPYIYDAGNVRVTFDFDIRTTTHVESFLEPLSASLNVTDNPIILEVKWDSFLPDIIRDSVQLTGRMHSAYSKYAASRMYD